MEESALQEALDEYNKQLLQVQAVLSSAEVEEQNQQELLKLRDDLIELVQITEESLLSLKKSKLLQLLDNQGDSQTCGENELKKDELFEEEDISTFDSSEEKEENEIVGTKCRVLHSHDWGPAEQHNAIVLAIESVAEDGSPDDTQVRVLFTNPTHMSMVPCPYFLDGKCAFHESKCRFSHGYIVKVADLKPFREPDFSKVDVGQCCLAKYDDGVWYKATIRSIDHGNHTFAIHYETYNSDATLALDSILPLDDPAFERLSGDTDDDSSEDDAELSSLSSISEPNKFISGEAGEEDETLRVAWKPLDGPSRLGDWEQHTRGIGSKLMAKMGYIIGKGLGKEGNGRVEPVEIVVLPQGKSLDRIAELREENKLGEPFKIKKKRKRKPKPCSIVMKKKSKRDDIFNFINTKLGGKKVDKRSTRVPQAGTSASDFELSDKTNDSKRKTEKDINWNVQLFKIHEEMAKVKKHLQHQQDALSRQLGRDSTTAAQIEQKMKDTRTHLSQLQTREKMVQQKLHHKKQHKKLTVF